MVADHAAVITDALDLVAAEKPWTTQDARVALDALLAENQQLRDMVDLSETVALTNARLVDETRAENQRWLTWSGGRYPDDSPGDVISAYADGSILLDDGILTWNPLRALEWIHDHPEALAGGAE